MVGAQNATKIASNFFPLRNKYSENTIIERTINNIRQFIGPMRLIKFLIIQRKVILIKYKVLGSGKLVKIKFFLTSANFSQIQVKNCNKYKEQVLYKYLYRS